MIDIHSHLLPNIDDGSRSAAKSIAVLTALADQGVNQIVLTPHVRASEIARDAEDPLERRDLAHAALRDAGVPARPVLHLGFEIMLDQRMPSVVTRDRRFAIAGSRYYLVEFPLTIVGEFARDVLAGISKSGVVPIVAHPERYDACSPPMVASWREVGAKIQLDATTLTRASTRGHRARLLLAHGLADVIAGDNHGDVRSVATGVDYLTGRGAEAQARLLSIDNPSAVLEDRELEAVPPSPLRETLLERWKRLARG